MIVCFSCSQETKALLDGLVATGQYPDHSAVLAAAISNLSVIHSEMKGGEALVLGSSSNATEELPLAVREVKTPDRTSPGHASSSHEVVANRLLKHRIDLQRPLSLLPVTADAAPVKKTLPLNEWLFGQFNRLLPAKVTCRILVNMMA